MKFLVTHADGSTREVEACSAVCAREKAMQEALAQNWAWLAWSPRVLISSVREVPNEKERSA